MFSPKQKQSERVFHLLPKLENSTNTHFYEDLPLTTVVSVILVKGESTLTPKSKINCPYL